MYLNGTVVLVSGEFPKSVTTTLETMTSKMPVNVDIHRIITFLLLTVLALLCIISFVGNIIILCAVGTSRRFRRPVNYMLGNLSVSSILIACTSTIYYLQPKVKLMNYGPWTCPAIPVILRFMVPAEGFTVMCISLDRSYSARTPWYRETSYSAKQKIAFIWAAAIMLELPHALFWGYDEDQPTYFKCYNKKQLFGSPWPFVVYICVHTTGTYVIPSILLIRDFVKLISLHNFLLAAAASQSTELSDREGRCVNSGNRNQNGPNHHSFSGYIMSRKRLVRNALIFTSVFICIKLPIGLWYSMYQLPPQVSPREMQTFVTSSRNYFMIVAFLHGLLYPLLIFVLSHELRLYLIFRKANRPRQLLDY